MPDTLDRLIDTIHNNASESIFADTDQPDCEWIESHLPWPEYDTGLFDRLPLRSHYHQRDFSRLRGDQMLRNLYRCLLRREPDQTGFQHYLTRLRQGASKQEIIHQIANSAEARQHATHIAGLWRYTLCRPLLSRPWLRLLATPLIRLLLDHEPAPPPLTPLEVSLQLQRQLTHCSRRAHSESLSQIAMLKKQMAQLQQRLSYQLSCSTQPQPQPPSPAPAKRDDLDVAAFYVAFEDAMRGSRAEIHQRQGAAIRELPPPDAHLNRVLDIGCGRGEWLQQLTEHGYQAKGIDTNPVMVDTCLQHGLDAQQGDALAWLKQQPDNSLCAITAFHVVEHIPFELLLRITSEATRVLCPGGTLLYETPNAENVLVGSHSFYHDPTHRNPITPTLLRFLAQYCGFAEIKLRGLQPHPPDALLPEDTEINKRFNRYFYGPQDILLIARK
jgi:O-antigen chain-terminating methyltransferase